MRHERNSVWYGSSDRCQMAFPEMFEVWAPHLTTIIADEGTPHKNLKNTFVLKWFWVNFKCFRLLFKKNINPVSDGVSNQQLLPGGSLDSAKSPLVVYMSNLRLLVLPLLIDFGEGSSCCSCCDRGKTKSTLAPLGTSSRTGVWKYNSHSKIRSTQQIKR